MQVTNSNVAPVMVDAIAELRVDVEEWAELDQLQLMEVFLWTGSSVRSGNVGNLQRAIRLVSATLQDRDTAIKNAVTVSFLEYIDPDDEIGEQIVDSLTLALRDQWEALDEYMLQLVGKSLRGTVARNASSRKS